MNITGLPELLISWLKSQGTEQLQPGKDSPLAQFKPGMQYEGKVLDALPNGRNLVLVGDQTMDMALPRQAGRGDVVRLTFLNAAPRPTFALNDSAAAAPAQPVNVSRAAQQVSALVRYMPVTQVAQSASPTVAIATAQAAPIGTPTVRGAPTTGMPAAGPATSAATDSSQTAAVVSTAARAATTIAAAQAGIATQAGVANQAGAAPRAVNAPPLVNAPPVANASPLANASAATNAASVVIASSTGSPVQASLIATTVNAGPTAALAGTTRAGNAVPVGNAAKGAAANAQTPLQTSAQPSAQTSAAGMVSRPIVANPALLLAPVGSGAVAATAVLGPAIPALAMAGEAVGGMRAALGSNASLTMAQGAVAEKALATHVLPMRLQQTLKESGLFYESHLGKWVRGEMSLESMQREPQARLAQMPGPLLNLPDLEGMPEEAARFASRQLGMLEGGPFLWHGQAWPGQLAEWLVREREAGGADGEEGGQKWHSQLRLILPRLGELSADLDIGAQGLRIRLKSPSPEALAEMNAALPELIERMRVSELNLSSVLTELADGRE